MILWLPAVFLLLVTLRRWLFTLVSLLLGQCGESSPSSGSSPGGGSSPASASPQPDVLLLVPFRDEASTLPALTEALRRLHYPTSHLLVVLVDDGSRDRGAALCAKVVEQQPNWRLLRLPRSLGKAAALNAALDRFPQGDFVAIYDADERPSPGALRRLVAACHPAPVAVASGRRTLANPLASPTTSYVAFENLVHQLITQQAKDRLRLAPAILGSNCLYRRRALEHVGRFRAGALLEDSDLTLRLAGAGWQLRYAPDAVSYHAAPETLAGYWRQHVRWAGGFQDVAQRQIAAILRNRALPWPLRLELALFAFGYADRLALATVTGLLFVSKVAGKRTGALRRILALALITPLLQVAAALTTARAPRALWLRLPLLPVYFFVDVTMALFGIARGLVGRRPVWQPRLPGAV